MQSTVGENQAGISLGTDIISAITLWCDAVQGRGPLRIALTELARSLGAGAAALSRVPHDAAQAPGLLSVVLDQKRKALPLERSFARDLFGRYFGKTQLGSTWCASMISDNPEALSSPFQRRMGFHELVVVPLADTGRAVDCLEFHFQDRAKMDQQALLNMISMNVATTWQNRSPGLFTDSLLERHQARAAPASDTPILSYENPARLSRMEFRVCVYLNRGYSLRHVREELQIGESTLRTHMRNIYAKTGSEGLSDLLYQILSTAPVSLEPRGPEARRA